MQLTGQVDINAPRAAVWALLMDVEALAGCGPGVDGVVRHDPTHATVQARVSLGFMTAGLSVDLELVEITAPDRVTVRGQGEASGNQVEATGAVTLTGPPAGPTHLAWTADLEIRGPLSSFASGFVEAPATRLIDQTIECLRARLAAT